MAYINGFTSKIPPRFLSKCISWLMCLMLIISLCPTAFATSVENELVVGMVSTKTTDIFPLEPLERDMMNVYDLMYDGLISLDDDYLPQPDLCERWEESGNGKTWTFYLRSGITFSDGTPVTANDVVATAQYILNKATDEESTDKGYYANLNYFVASITAQNETTVVVKTKNGRNYYGLLFAMTFPILPADKLEMANPPGTGGYIVTTFIPQDYLWMQVNENWWQQEPKVQQIMVVLYPNNKELISSYEYAQVDAAFTRSVSAAQYKSGTNALSMSYRTPQLEVLLMNHSEQALKSVNVRKAIRYAVNIDLIASQVYMNMVLRTNTPMISGTWMYSEPSGEYQYNVEKAIALLEGDGWFDSNDDGVRDRIVNDKAQKLRIRLFVYEEPDNDVRVEAANLIADALTKIGFEISVTTKTQAEVAENLSAGSFDMVLCGFQMDVCPDPGFLLMSGNIKAGNFGRYKNKAMDALFTELRSQYTQQSYAATLSKIQQLYTEDCPFLCLYYRNGTVLTRKMYTTARDIREMELLRGIDTFGR